MSNTFGILLILYFCSLGLKNVTVYVLCSLVFIIFSIWSFSASENLHSVLSYLSYVSIFFLCECLAGILEIRTVSEGGILAIKGVKSQYYISMNKGGQLQGKVMFFY